MANLTSQIDLCRDGSYVNHELKELLKQSGPISSLSATTDIHVLRETLKQRKLALTAAGGSEDDGQAAESDHVIATHDGAQITLRIYQGPQSKGGPAMVMLHGGGWCLGGLDSEALLCRRWCKELGGVAFSVDYRLAPEAKFPTAVYDAYDAVKWIAENAGKFDADLKSGFVVAGISAGANLSAVVSHLARDEGLQPALTGIYLSIPSLCDPYHMPEGFRGENVSHEQNQDAPILNKGAMGLFRKLYEGDPSSPLMSPLLFETGHVGLPPTYLQVCGMDPLRDEGIIYERMLREQSGVKTRLDLYPGLPHGFWSWWPHAEFSRKQQRDSMEGLRWLLEASKQAALLDGSYARVSDTQSVYGDG